MENLEELRHELAEMRTAMEQQQSRIVQLEAATPGPSDRPLRSRRQMLKLAGATVAGAAAAAAGIAGSAVPGLAATGGNMILGANKDAANANQAANATEVDYTGGASPGVGLLGQIGTVWAPSSSSYAAAVAGWSTVLHTPNGVYGWTDQATGKGVVGYANGGVGVFGGTNTGYGGQFILNGATAKAHLLLSPGSTAGAPAPAGHVAGELFVDSAGVLYYFNAGAFRPLAGGAGGIVTMLSAPIRLLETRPAYQDPSAGQTKPGRKLNNGATFDLQIMGQVMGGLSVPAGAKAVIGNVTATGPVNAGYLTLFPQGSPRPNTSSINYGAGAMVANGVSVGLSMAGFISIYVVGQTHVIFDAAGHIM
jgi:hypothetical protein